MAAEYVIGIDGRRLYRRSLRKRTCVWSIRRCPGEFREHVQRSHLCNDEPSAADESGIANRTARQCRGDISFRSSTAEVLRSRSRAPDPAEEEVVQAVLCRTPSNELRSRQGGSASFASVAEG